MTPESSWTPPDVAELSTDFTSLEISHLLARGGMSAVYLARQVSLDREVVLKILPKEVALNAGDVARLKMEARLLAKLRDPGIVKIYDAGISSGGYPYLLLEYVEGGDLRHWASARAVTLEEAMGIGQSLSTALAAAHGEGVLHGDIKPDNVFLDAKGRLKLGDFGLAEFTGAASAAYHTPGYTAPEILAGERQITVQTDLYAVAATVFELVCGTTPPEDASRREELLAALPVQARQAILTGLATVAGERPASAADYREIFRRASLHPAPAEAARAVPGPVLRRVGPQPGMAAPARPVSRRGSRGLWLAGAAAALAAAGAVIFLNRTGSDPVPKDTVAQTEPPQSSPPDPVASVKVADQSTAPSTGTDAAAGGTGTESFADWLAAEGTQADSKENTPVLDRHPLTREELDQWSPGWTIDAPNGEQRDAARLSVSGTTSEGHPVLLLVPFSPSKPYTLSRRAELPQDPAQELRVRVAANTPEGADWVLRAFVDDQPLGKPEIISQAAEEKDRYREIAWSLEPWRGRTVTLRLEGANGGAHSWHWEQGFWSWIKLQPLTTGTPAGEVERPEITMKSPQAPSEKPDRESPAPAAGRELLDDLKAKMAAFHAAEWEKYLGKVRKDRQERAKALQATDPATAAAFAASDPGQPFLTKEQLIADKSGWELPGLWDYPHVRSKVTYLPGGRFLVDDVSRWRWLDRGNGLFATFSPGHVDFGQVKGKKATVVNHDGRRFEFTKIGEPEPPLPEIPQPIRVSYGYETEYRKEFEETVRAQARKTQEYAQTMVRKLGVKEPGLVISELASALKPYDIEHEEETPEDIRYITGKWRAADCKLEFWAGGRLKAGRDSGRWIWTREDTVIFVIYGPRGVKAAGLARISSTEKGVLRIHTLIGDPIGDARYTGGEPTDSVIDRRSGRQESGNAAPMQQAAPRKPEQSPAPAVPQMWAALSAESLAKLRAIALASWKKAGSPKRPDFVMEGGMFYEGKWYARVDKAVSWKDAKAACEAVKGRLAVVHDAQTWEFVQLAGGTG